jgi:DNA-binding transcriptional LysR family regulator
MIELRTLGYFAAACRCDKLAHAADELGIAQSTLSSTLKALEEELGVPLFRRVNCGLYPTAGARWLLRIAEPLLDAEAFARRWVAATKARRPRLVTVELALSFTVGGIGEAVERAIETAALERPNIFADPVWIDEKDSPRIAGLSEAWPGLDGSRIVIGLAPERKREGSRATTLFTDRWVFACRLPTGTVKPVSAAELAAGRLVVPALAPALIEQADRYFTRNKMSSVRFINEHPGELPRLIDDYPDAALFVPESLISPRLGLLRVKAVLPASPLTMTVVAHTPASNPTTALFVRHLKRALKERARASPRQPAINLRQIHYFNMVQRLRRVSAAAHGANVSQPALSDQLQKLERTLATRLFERRGDGVIPTVAGERFANVAKMIETGFRRLTEGEVAAAAPLRRRIAVGILPSVSQHGLLVNRITEAVLAVQDRRPDLKLIVREAPNGTLQDWVMRGLVGVAIVETSLPHMPRLPLGSSEGLAAVAHARHRLLPAGPITFADLVRLPLALPTISCGLRQLVEAAAEERGLRIQPYMEIDALTMVAALLARAPVCTVLPPSAIGREIAEGALVVHPIVEPAIARRLFVIYSGERTLSEPERDLVGMLRARLSAGREAELTAPAYSVTEA